MIKLSEKEKEALNELKKILDEIKNYSSDSSG